MLKLLADAHPSAVAQLSYQYRMNADICQFSNDLVYNGALKCGNDAVRDQLLELMGFPESVAPEWLRQVLDPSSPVVFVNTDPSSGETFMPLEHMQAGKIVNDTEAKLVTTIISSLLTCGVRGSSIGVICPFRAQVSRQVCGLWNCLVQLLHLFTTDSKIKQVRSSCGRERRRFRSQHN